MGNAAGTLRDTRSWCRSDGRLAFPGRERAAMMFLVRIALQRPYTFVVMALLIALLGVGSIATMPTDIFPAINIPVVSVIWTYNGISPDDMANRIVTISERAMTTTVNDIEHIESRSYNGLAVIRVYFQPPDNVQMGSSYVTALSQPL